MTANSSRKLGKIINICYVALILGIAYLFIKYCLGTLFPLIFAFFVAMIVQKPTNACYKKIGKGKGVIATVLVILLLLILALILLLVGAQIVSSGKDFMTFVRQKISDFPTLIGNIEAWSLRAISFLPDSIEMRLHASIVSSMERFKELTAAEAASALVQTASDSNNVDIKSIISPIGGGVWSFVKGIPSVLIASLFAIIAACFMAADYDRIVGFFKNQLNPPHRLALSRSKALLLLTLKQLIQAYGTIMLSTFVELLLGLYIMKFAGIYDSNYIIAISAITAVVDIVPVLGTGTITVPWALYSLITGKISFAIGLMILYVIILILRQILEPKLVAIRLGLPPIVTIVAMYFGTQLFGILGVFLMPILCIMVKRLNDEGILHLWKPLEPAADTPAADDSEEAENH